MKRTKIINNMKALKIFAVAALAMILAAPCRANVSSAAVPAAQTTSTSLTKNNGAAAGKALLALYTQYKSDGSLDMTNPTNILNMVALADNIKELKSSVNTTNFIAGLISGSGKLVNNSNSGTVIGSLTKLAGMDLSSLRASAKTAEEAIKNAPAAAKTAAGKAAKSVASEALSRLASSKNASTAVSNAKEVASAASTLSTLFKTLKK